MGGKPRVNLGFLSRANAWQGGGHMVSLAMALSSYKKACNYIWVGFK